MDIIVKNIHWLFFFYAIMIGFEMYETQSVKLEEANNVASSAKIVFERTKKDLVDVKKFKNDLKKSEEEVEDVVKNIEKIQRQLPSQINDGDVNSTLVDFAKRLKILNPEPNPQAEIDNKFYIAKEYEFIAEGTYLQFLIFFENLENLSKSGRILNVKNISLEPSENSDPRSRFKILRLKSTIEAYKYNPSFNVKDL